MAANRQEPSGRMKRDKGSAMATHGTRSNDNAKVVPLRSDQESLVRRRAAEREFLPAMLEITETPPSPTWRITALTLCALLAGAVAWACLAKVDIVAVAPGKVIPIGQVKVVQPLETATIRAIHVDDGDHVKAGDLLVELDPTDAQADLAALRYDRSQAVLDAASADFLIANDEAGPFGAPDDIAAALVSRSHLQALQELRKYHADLAGLEADTAEKRAALTSNAAQIERARALIPLMSDRYETMRALYDQHISPKPPMLDAEQNLVERQADLKGALGTAEQIDAELHALAAKKSQVTSSFVAEAMDRLTKAAQKKAELDGQIAKSEQKARDRHLIAPIAGTIQDMNVHTTGAVVTMADVLMTIVPDQTGVEIAADVANDDIGFVHDGQLVEVKFDAFPFTRYGLIRGTLSHIGRDVQQSHSSYYPGTGHKSPSTGTTTVSAADFSYPARIALVTDNIAVDGRHEHIQPGMRVSAEIKTGRRSVISYLLSPVIALVSETGHER